MPLNIDSDPTLERILQSCKLRTMRYLLPIVEQLDRAARELSTDHPINNRLALILVDNSTELIVHRQCMDLLQQDSFASGFQKELLEVISHSSSSPKSQTEYLEELSRQVLRPKQRARANGRRFEDKLKVLKQVEDLTESERRFIAIAHNYRNELYHIGLTHNDIIRAIVGQYYALCCRLFGRMGQRAFYSHSVSSTDTYTDTALRYLPSRNGNIDLSSVDRTALAQKLHRALPGGMPNLSKTLAAKAHTDILEVKEQFDFMVENNPNNLGSDELLKHIQFQSDFVEAAERADYREFSTEIDPRGGVNKLIMTFGERWKPKHYSIPDKKWKLRADEIEEQDDPLVAMDLYQSLRNSMSDLEEVVLTAAGDLDRWIQQQIDEARGK